MEVHAHSHTERKKFTHYLWEFLMLFLAVFCGFLAENQREHMVEKARAKQYIRSFYDDLRGNLASFSKILTANEAKTAAFDNIFLCYDSMAKNTTCLANMIKLSQYFLTVAFDDGTIEQLKNAGGLRLLDKEDRDSILKYDKYTRNYRDWEATAMQQSQDNVRNTFDVLGHFLANKFLYADTIGADKIPILFTTDKNSINRMFNVLFRYRQFIIRQSRWMTDIKEQTNALIKYFKLKYHFG